MKKKIAILLLIVLAIIGLSYFLITRFDIASIKNAVGDNLLFWSIIVLLQAFQVVFIPISNQIISVPLALLFKDELLKVFVASWIGVEIGTMALYFIGRYGGEKLLKWLLEDTKKVEKCKEFIKKGKPFYVVGMLVALIPDDILTTLTGVAKYNFWFVLVASSITRAICIFCSVYGFGILTQFWWGWLILAFGGIIILVTTFLLFRKGSNNNDIKN